MVQKLIFSVMLSLVCFIPVSWVFSSPVAAQEVMSWKLSKVYWRQNAPNPHVRIKQNQADSRGGSIDLEHFPYDPGCREAAVKASYRWRFDKDISFLSGKKGALAFVNYPSVEFDTGKGCWNPAPSLFWGPGKTNDFAWLKCINDKGECRSYLKGNQISSVEVFFNSYVRDGYKGEFIVTIAAHGISGGWIREAVYEFERAVGQPQDSKETFCDQYAKAAVSQNEENIRKKCGYRGDNWQSNYKNHFGWCLGADKNTIEAQRRGRNEALLKCSGALKFTNPTIGGYRIDRCLTWGQQCDQPAADKFCQDKGFSGASSYNWEHVQPTLILGTGQICKGEKCGGFSFIECFEARK